MIDTTIELISLAASNSLMVFCFCNLLIAILLVGSSKPAYQLNSEKLKVTPTENFKKNSDSLSEKKEVSSVSMPLISNEDGSPDDDDDDDDELRKSSVSLSEKKEVSSVSMPLISNEDRSPDDDDDQEQDDDELRKRVEEFIEKINNGWRAEKVNIYS